MAAGFRISDGYLRTRRHVPVELGADARQMILRLQAEMEAMPQIDCPLKHHFAPGSYAREILLPAGSIVVGKIHKHAHVNVISKGRVTVYTEFGCCEMSAPTTFISEPGTKRVVVAHEDTVWTTVHATDETDLAKIEDEVIAKSYEQLALCSRPSLKELQ